MDDAAIVDMFAEIVPVRVRRMFGGRGIFDGERMFGLVFDGEIYLKTSDETKARFAAAGSRPFTYTARSRERETGYWSLPEAALDDSDALRVWTVLALQVAQEKALRRRGSSSRRLPR